MISSSENGWENIRDAAATMFNVWVDGTELAWAEEAWAHLHAAGLVGDETVMGVTAANLRLVTLARVYEKFCELVWDESLDTPIEYLADGLDIDPTALGLLAAAEDANQFDEIFDEAELREVALTLVTDGQRAEIYHCLKAAYGGNIELYSRLLCTRSGGNRQGDEDDLGDEGEGYEGTTANSLGMSFIKNGFREG